MKLNEYKNIIKKYQKKYIPKLSKIKKEYIKCMKNYNKELLKKTMLNHRRIIKELILDVVNEFKEFKKIKCCIIISGSLARGTNTLYSDIDINYFYDNKNFDKMINIEERVNYILQTIMKFRGKDRIHSMVVYLPLIKKDNYESIKNNRYPIYFDDDVIYNICRENAEKLMYETFNSTRDINDLCNYLNSNDNDKIINEWSNCFELIYDNNLYKKFVEQRNICKNKKNIKKFIMHVMNSINNDDYYMDKNVKEIKIKELKYFYKMLVLDNAYKILSIYFRINDRFNTINIFDFEKRNIGISHEFYNDFYEYLNLIQKLQYLLDGYNIDLSYHSSKIILSKNLNKKYKRLFNSDNILSDLNKLKQKFYKTCKIILEKETKKYEK